MTEHPTSAPGSEPDRPGVAATPPAGAGPSEPPGPSTDEPTVVGAPGPGAPLSDEPTVVVGGAADEPTRVIGDAGAPRDGWTADGGSTGVTGDAGAAGTPGSGAGSYRYEPPGAGAPPYGPPHRRLQRSTDRKVVAGVAGGLGEYTGIDPVLFRVLFAVLTVFGGVGVLLYVVGWLFLPAADQQVSRAESLIGRGGRGGRGTDIVKAAALVVAGLILAGVVSQGDSGDVLLLILVVGGGVLLVRNLNERRDGRPPLPPPAVPPPAPYQPYQQQPYPAYEQPAGSPFGAPAGTATRTDTYPVPPPVAGRGARKERSILGALTLSALLVVLGVTAALDAGGALRAEARDYLALALGVLGLGLVVGAVLGRARGLVWLGIPLALALVAVSTADVSLEGGTGDREYRPQAVAEVQKDYRIGVGSVRLDLTDLDFTGQAVSTRVSAGIGNVEVLVPRDVDVDVVGRSRIGEADLFGALVNGTSSERSVVDQGPDGEGGGTLRLVLEVGVGRVEVDRATA